MSATTFAIGVVGRFSREVLRFKPLRRFGKPVFVGSGNSVVLAHNLLKYFRNPELVHAECVTCKKDLLWDTNGNLLGWQ